MEESSSKKVLSGFATFLSDSQLIDKPVALEALQQANNSKTSYIDYLVKEKILDELHVGNATAEYFGLPFCDINAFDSDLIPPEFLNILLVKKKQALPLFKKSGLLYIAITDPTLENLYEVRFLTGLDVRFLIVEGSKLVTVIDDLLNTLILSEINTLNGEHIDAITINAYKDEEADLSAYDVESAPVVNYVNRVLLDAIEKGASDIHFEHYEDSYRIRIKVISNLDITEHRVPQDGRFKLFLSKKRAVDFRVSVCPTLFGEKTVLRILDPSQVTQGIAALGMEPLQTENFLKSLQRSQGMILVTGPTGSGKTVTLYSGLNFLNSTEKNISTVEDPVEIPMQGVNQVNVNLKAGLNFSNALRSFLRQDPDIIMVGEIRDLETAEIAVKAAQTGHLVLSTLHTNSAPEAVSRLMNMGIESYNLASSLTLVIAQRLVRSLCIHCRIKQDLPEDILLREGFTKEEIPTLEIYEPGSCDRCMHGYKGRVGIFEVMPISRDMAFLIMEGGNALQIMDKCKSEGILNLRESGLIKVKSGLTSLSELNRVFN
jgi:type IV pilus assembly protein PilB